MLWIKSALTIHARKNSSPYIHPDRQSILSDWTSARTCPKSIGLARFATSLIIVGIAWARNQQPQTRQIVFNRDGGEPPSLRHLINSSFHSCKNFFFRLSQSLASGKSGRSYGFISGNYSSSVSQIRHKIRCAQCENLKRDPLLAGCSPK